MYTYAVKEVVKVVDGDTVDNVIDLGFSLSLKQRIRIKGNNTAELHTNNETERAKRHSVMLSNGSLHLVLWL